MLMQLSVPFVASAQDAGRGELTLADPGRPTLSGIGTWSYQLQRVEPATIAGIDADLVVVDYSRDGTAETVFSGADVRAMQHKPSGARRTVLAYLSIGEAEDYRFYWDQRWAVEPPDWLGDENPDWEGNYAVRYWNPEWQGIVYGSGEAYLDRIILAGFDGVYLDRIDAFDVPDTQIGKRARVKAMASFVLNLAAYARARAPDFFVVAQNAEELLADPDYRDGIDGLAKEDLFFGLDGDGVTNSNSEVRASLDPIQAFQRTGKPVLLVEYLADADDISLAREKAEALGVPLFIGNRDLDNAYSR